MATIVHGLRTTPTFIRARLAVATPYRIDPHQMHVGGAASRGLVIVPDATNLNIRFGEAPRDCPDNCRAFTETGTVMADETRSAVPRPWGGSDFMGFQSSAAAQVFGPAESGAPPVGWR
jgi:hypothetical protein